MSSTIEGDLPCLHATHHYATSVLNPTENQIPAVKQVIENNAFVPLEANDTQGIDIEDGADDAEQRKICFVSSTQT